MPNMATEHPKSHGRRKVLHLSGRTNLSSEMSSMHKHYQPQQWQNLLVITDITVIHQRAEKSPSLVFKMTKNQCYCSENYGMFV